MASGQACRNLILVGADGSRSKFYLKIPREALKLLKTAMIEQTFLSPADFSP
jgi:hypothetical protein